VALLLADDDADELPRFGVKRLWEDGLAYFVFRNG
jgi:hypothetical protein